MDDSVSKIYNKVLKDLNLDDFPINEYDDLDVISLVIDLERAFNIQIDDNKIDDLVRNGSHESFIDYIRTLV